MENHSIIVISAYDNIKNKKNSSFIYRVVNFFTVSVSDLPTRIAISFLPPMLGDLSQHVYVDFVGPCLALLTMAAILHYGHAYKTQSAALEITPSELLLYYSLTLPLICYFLAKIGRTYLKYTEILSLLGYGLYGHIFTLAFSQLLNFEENNIIFFINLLLFGGLSAIRIAVVLIASIPVPAARLLVCSVVTIAHLMFLIFVYFAFMHSTFIYGSSKTEKYFLESDSAI